MLDGQTVIKRVLQRADSVSIDFGVVSSAGAWQIKPKPGD